MSEPKVVEVHGKKVLVLPDAIDLSDPASIRRAIEQAELAAVGPTDPIAIEVKPPDPHPLTKREFIRAALFSVGVHLDSYRAAPRDDTDPFDHGGAMACLTESEDISGRPPQDDVGDLFARAAIMGVRIDSSTRRACERANATLPDEDDFREWCRNTAERTSFAMSAAAAWARDGFVTYDLTAGLWDVLKRSMDDPGVAATPVSAITPPQRAFAVRIPGPDYPVIDSHQIRGFMLYAFDDAPRGSDIVRVREAMTEASPGDDGPFLRKSLRHEAQAIYRDLADAARAALPYETVPSFLLVMAGYSLEPEGPRCAAAIDTAQLLMRLGTRGPHVSLREANEYAMQDTAMRNDASIRGRLPGDYDDIVNAALGMCLYLASVPDPGKPVRAKPVRKQGGKPVTPNRRLIGQGVKAITEREG